MLAVSAGRGRPAGARHGCDAGGIAARSAAAADEVRRFSAAFADAAATVTPAVVRIQTERGPEDGQRGLQERMRDLFDRLPEGHPDLLYPSVAGGTGVLVSPDGLILTNTHVIAGASRITVTLADKRVFDATVVGADPTTDIALIMVGRVTWRRPTWGLGRGPGRRVGDGHRQPRRSTGRARWTSP
jgi:S1-C subfamily serine protease